MSGQTALEDRIVSGPEMRLVSVSSGGELRPTGNGGCRKCENCLGSKCVTKRELERAVGAMAKAA
jgi:hypothetical protein